jgi:peptidoglycan/xylan/chitin deacetylase (PgdA/CDA1 family)
MFIEQSSNYLSWIFRAVWRINDGTKTLYLTFDDGPCPEITPQVLDILDNYGIKATFFCVGDNVRKYPEIFSEIIRRGHAVGNHTMHHISGFTYDYKAYIKDITEADNYIKSPLLRPPYGRISRRELRVLRKKYKIIMWDVITRDYNIKISPEKVLKIVKRYTRNGSIIVFHDSLKAAKNMLPVLPKAIEWLLEKGYTFEKIK